LLLCALSEFVGEKNQGLIDGLPKKLIEASGMANRKTKMSKKAEKQQENHDPVKISVYALRPGVGIHGEKSLVRLDFFIFLLTH
jgi:hypothetical protein